LKKKKSYSEKSFDKSTIAPSGRKVASGEERRERVVEVVVGALISHCRAGKSLKMSERGHLKDVKCPQSCVDEILQNWQLYLL
jgi:hypothetical protein